MHNVHPYQLFIARSRLQSVLRAIPLAYTVKLTTMADGKSLTIGRLHQDLQETSTEADARKAGNFSDVEGKLLQRWSADEVSHVETATAFLGLSNPFGKSANPKDHKVWLLDNVAYRPIRPQIHAPQPWRAEFVACFFHTGRQVDLFWTVL
jgi:hypothetical protein